MKIYIFDRGPYGCAITCANSKKEAFDIMKKNCTDSYLPNNEIDLEEYDPNNFFYENLGEDA